MADVPIRHSAASDRPTTAAITLAFDRIFDRRGGPWTLTVYSP